MADDVQDDTGGPVEPELLERDETGPGPIVFGTVNAVRCNCRFSASPGGSGDPILVVCDDSF